MAYTKSADKPTDVRTKAAKQTEKPYKPVSAHEIERIIEMVNGTMTIENMPLTEDDRKRLREIMQGLISADETVKQLIEKHRRNANV